MHIKTLFSTSTIDIIYFEEHNVSEEKYENANNINKWQKNVFVSIQFNMKNVGVYWGVYINSGF